MSDAERFERLIACSGKMVFLDKLLVKLRGEGKKVLIFSQFKIMLNVLEELLQAREYVYERLDGAVTGNVRQRAIDRARCRRGGPVRFEHRREERHIERERHRRVQGQPAIEEAVRQIG